MGAEVVPREEGREGERRRARDKKKMRKDGVRREKKQDHRGRRRGLREGEKGEWEKGEGGGGGGHGVQIRLSFSSRKTERERENRVVQRSAFGFLWQQQAIILNCHLL